MNKSHFTLPFITAALLTVAPFAFAEDEKPAAPAATETPKGPIAGRAPGERLKEMSEKLGLTEEQKGKIKTIFEANMPKFKELRADTALSAEDRRTKSLALRKSEMEEIRAVLTPEQQEKMKELRTAGKPAK